jgi:AraC-like DNA-binding protein
MKFLLDGNYKLLLKDLGVDLPDFLAQAKLPYNLFDLSQPMVTTDEYYRMWDALTNYGENMMIPLQAGMLIQPEMFSPALIVALLSHNGKSGLQRVIKYKKLVAPMGFELRMQEDYGDLIIKSNQAGGRMPLGLVAFEMIFMTRILSIGTREDIKPLLVQSKEKIKAKAYEDVFGVKPVVGNENIIRYKKEDLEQEFLTKNQGAWNFYLKGLDQRLEELEKEDNFTDVVKTKLERMLPTGEVSIEALANELGVSKRTIQRNLAVNNTTFKEQLKHVREEFAKKYLKNTNISIKEVAFLLGYEEPNSFARAFKAWTGKTVTEYRI